MTFKTDILRKLIDDQKGIASNNRFQVTLPSLETPRTAKPGNSDAYAIDPFPVRDLPILCTAARLPGKQVITADRKLGIEPINVAVGHNFAEVNLTFYLTNAYSVRKYFQEWSECIISPEPPFVAGFFEDYAKSVTVSQLDKLGKVIYSVELTKAYPTTITEVEFNNQLQGAPLEFSVSLAFTNYLIKPLLETFE